jgi:hypothetical protein
LLLSRWAWRLGPAPGDQQTAGRASARALADRSIVPVQEKNTLGVFEYMSYFLAHPFLA